jgi:hypothetical protein
VKFIRPVWTQSIFEVLDKFYDFTKYFGFQKLLGIWMIELVVSKTMFFVKTVVLLKF